MLKKIDEYYLNIPIREVFEVRELNSQEYAMFESAGVRMIFPEEKIYHGRNILFVGAVWKIVLGTSKGNIYRIAAQTVCLDRNEAVVTFNATYRILFEEMNTPNSGVQEQSFVWDTTEGNVILELTRGGDNYVVQICLTSGLIRRQTRELCAGFYKAYKDGKKNDCHT